MQINRLVSYTRDKPIRLKNKTVLTAIFYNYGFNVNVSRHVLREHDYDILFCTYAYVICALQGAIYDCC